MRSDHRVELTIDGEQYLVFIERSWEWDGGEAINDGGVPVSVNDIDIDHFTVPFADKVSEAVDKWIEDNEPPRLEPPEYEPKEMR